MLGQARGKGKRETSIQFVRNSLGGKTDLSLQLGLGCLQLCGMLQWTMSSC